MGIGKLAYDVIVERELSDLGFKLVVLVLVFLFGIGLGVVSIKGFQNTNLLMIAQFYAWIYVAIACLSYFGIAFALNQKGYTFGTYVAFILVIAVELLAMYALHVVIDNHDIRQYSIPILTVCLVHGILIVYSYVFVAVPVSFFLVGDLIFFTAMTLVGSSMLGDVGFATMLSRIWDEANKSMPSNIVPSFHRRSQINLQSEDAQQPEDLKIVTGNGEKSE